MNRPLPAMIVDLIDTVSNKNSHPVARENCAGVLEDVLEAVEQVVEKYRLETGKFRRKPSVVHDEDHKRRMR